jgi:predicted nucleotidyltransferase
VILQQQIGLHSLTIAASILPMNFRQLLNGQPTPYADLNVVLCDLVTRVRNVLGDNFIGAYLQGSFAVGDFDIYSDVDFLILLNQDIPDDQFPPLRALHADIFKLDCAWAQHLEGSYIPRAALVRLPPPPRKFLYLDHGSTELIRSAHDDSLVVYWSLRERGITLIGPEPRSLVAPVPADALRQEVFDTMHTWREQLLRNPDEMDNRFYQPFAVLSYCRMLHTLESGTVRSKRAGAMWAKDALDSRWHQLIQGAWDARPGDPSLKVRQKADSSDLRSTWEFMEYAVELSRQRKENRKPVGPAAAGQPEC